MAAGRSVGTIGGLLLALEADLFLLVGLIHAGVLTVGAGAEAPLAIAPLVSEGGRIRVARAIGDVEATERGECRRIGGKVLVTNLFLFFLRHQ